MARRGKNCFPNALIAPRAYGDRRLGDDRSANREARKPAFRRTLPLVLASPFLLRVELPASSVAGLDYDAKRVSINSAKMVRSDDGSYLSTRHLRVPTQACPARGDGRIHILVFDGSILYKADDER